MKKLVLFLLVFTLFVSVQSVGMASNETDTEYSILEFDKSVCDYSLNAIEVELNKIEKLPVFAHYVQWEGLRVNYTYSKQVVLNDSGGNYINTNLNSKQIKKLRWNTLQRYKYQCKV